MSYVCRRNDALIVVACVDFLDDYVNRTPLSGDAFTIDAGEHHVYIQSFIAGNKTAEAKILPYANESNGRLDFVALKEHYEGVGANARELILADRFTDTLYYTG